MRHTQSLSLLAFLFVTVTAWAADAPATCVLQAQSITGRSASGGAQVSNVGDIEIECSVPARPFPSKPGQFRNGLVATATSNQISQDGAKDPTPVEVHVSGGGSDYVRDWTTFSVHIPLKPAERDAEARRYLNRLQAELSKESRHPSYSQCCHNRRCSKSSARACTSTGSATTRSSATCWTGIASSVWGPSIWRSSSKAGSLT